MLPARLQNFIPLFHDAAEKGLLLLLACIVAIVMANTSLSGLYDMIANSYILYAGSKGISLSMIVNDFLMVLFFLFVGLEIKREMLEGNLSSPSQRVLPVVSAIGGVLGPITIYCALNFHDGVSMRGWAVPSATDIAFALGMFSLLGKGMPVSLRVFLTALAVIDDLIAVLLIGLFYSTDIHVMYIGMASLVLLGLVAISICNVGRVRYYVLLGGFLWYCILQSGIHSTIAGVLLGMCIPISDVQGRGSPLRRAERALHPWIMFVILPLFAFLSSGVSLRGAELDLLHNTISLGIIMGLVFGKPIGIMASMLLLRVVRVVKAESLDFNIYQFFAVSLLCGIGFTMSLFIGDLAFYDSAEIADKMRVGVLVGSTISAFLGGAVMYFLRKAK